MSEKTREVNKIQGTMYTQSLWGETIYKYLQYLYFQWPEYEHRFRKIHNFYKTKNWGGLISSVDCTQKKRVPKQHP